MQIEHTADAGAELRWRNWQLRGVEGDRRRARIMTGVVALIGAGLGIALLLQFI